MTQDVQFSAEANPFAAAEQVCATLGSLTDALFDEHTSRHPAASLSAPRAAEHPAAEALFGLPLAPNGPVHTALDRLGTVLTAGTARPGTGARVADRVTTALQHRYGGGAVRGAIADRGTTSAALFQLPVTGEFADAKLRPPFAPALAALAAGQQTRQPVELATGAGAEVRLVIPPGFHPLTSPGGPAGASARTVPALPGAGDGTGRTDGADRATVAAAAELTGHLAEVAEELFSATGPEPRRDFAVISATLSDLIRDAGVRYAGVCALELDGRASDATLVISLARHPLPITALATELATVRRHAEVWTVLLPAGPAAVLVEGRTVPVPGPLAADGQRRWVVTSAVQAFVPLPDGGTVLCAQLSTARPEGWGLYTEAFAELLKSIQFGWDGEPVAAPVAPAVAPVTVDEPVVAAEEVPEQVPEEQPVHLRGTPVRVPPADFNPFAPVAAEAAGAAEGPTEAEAGTAGGERPKGTPVMIPPPDFNPFAMADLPSSPADEPATRPAGGGAAADPFGTTVAAEEKNDPFGTTLASQGPAVPPPPSTPPLIPAQTPSAADAPVVDTSAASKEEPAPRKGTPVMIPPPDFNPFAMADLPSSPADESEAEPETDAEPEHRPFG